MELRSDGMLIGYIGTSPHGQGHDTSFSMVLADELGVPMDRITLVHGDTDQVAGGGGTFASRSLQFGGSALRQAALALCELARGYAAAALRVDERDITLDRSTGSWHARDDSTTTPSVTWECATSTCR